MKLHIVKTIAAMLYISVNNLAHTCDRRTRACRGLFLFFFPHCIV